MKYLRIFVKLLIIIGAINWGLVGFFKYNLVADMLGPESALTRFIYDLVGIAGVLALGFICKSCCSCGSSCGSKCSCGCCNKEQGSQHHHQ